MKRARHSRGIRRCRSGSLRSRKMSRPSNSASPNTRSATGRIAPTESSSRSSPISRTRMMGLDRVSSVSSEIMNFDLDTWKISDLLKVYEEKRLDLTPPYQRNEVWTAKAQQKLLESILRGKPIPSFFLLKKADNSFEMIDGQQRARTIIGYWKNLIVDHENLTFAQRVEKAQARRRASADFLGYRLSITIVTEIH